MKIISDILCAWCVPPSAEDSEASHGICHEHAQQLQEAHEMHKFNKVPSYVGERSQFERYKQAKEARG